MLARRVLKIATMIKGVFYSEFDNVAGPQIVFQAPYKQVQSLSRCHARRSLTLWICLPLSVRSVLSNEVFDSVSGYIIIDKALCGKIITGSVLFSSFTAALRLCVCVSRVLTVS